MKPAQDLAGRVFGELTAVKRVALSDRMVWECLCSCGNTVRYNTSQLNCGKAKTCKGLIHKQPYKEGEVVGQLTVVKLHRDAKNRRYMANTKCSCGKLHTTAVKNMQRSKNANCGCLRDYSGRGLPIGEAALNSLISSYRGNAKSKGLVFKLSTEDCVKLFNGNCSFCGEPPSSIFTKASIKGSYTYSSIDRIDSTKGYTKDNTESCCTTCNYLKSNKTNKEFLDKVLAIAAYQGMSW